MVNILLTMTIQDDDSSDDASAQSVNPCHSSSGDEHNLLVEKQPDLEYLLVMKLPTEIPE